MNRKITEDEAETYINAIIKDVFKKDSIDELEEKQKYTLKLNLIQRSRVDEIDEKSLRVFMKVFKEMKQNENQ